MSHSIEVLSWPAPNTVHACYTTRRGGHSVPPYDSFNLGHTVDDQPQSVQSNRLHLEQLLALPTAPTWLDQVHGATVVDSAQPLRRTADAAIAIGPGSVCAILTADCLPLFLACREGTCVGLSHCGWRGIAAGVIENTVRALQAHSPELIAYLGPAIGPDAYEVGPDMRAEVLRADPQYEDAFRSVSEGRWYADLYAMARRRLRALGVTQIHGGDRCTASEPSDFYSYRRDGNTGRMASLIWLE